MKKTLFALPALALAAACAQSPDAIAPVSMGGAFDGLSCSKARAMLAAEQQTLASLSASQKSAVTGDAIGVFLIGVPVSSLSGGDQAGAIATSKGKIVALENRLLRC
jgi:hypothetical protein